MPFIASCPPSFGSLGRRAFDLQIPGRVLSGGDGRWDDPSDVGAKAKADGRSPSWQVPSGRFLYSFWVPQVLPTVFLKMSQKASTLPLILANLLMPIALLTFATGFFPYKPIVPGRASFAHSDNSIQYASPPFNKVIFMVVDALRRLIPQDPFLGRNNR